MQKKRIGILLSGGAASGMNKAVQTLFFLFSSAGYDVIGFKGGWLGLMNNDCKTLTSKDVFGISNLGGGILRSCTKINVFAQDGQDRSADCQKTYDVNNLEGVFVLGGDGSIRQAQELAEKTRMKFLTLPCTLDMDVLMTEETIGFYTAVNEAARVIKAMSLDGHCMNRNVVIETMGRSSGAVATYATAKAIESGTKIDFLVIPEIPYQIQNIVDMVKWRKNPIVIVVAEGATNKVQLQNLSGIHQQLSGTGECMAQELQKLTKKVFKSTSCGYSQRSGETSEADQFLANQFAEAAVQEFFNGNKNISICFQNHSFVAVPLFDIAKANRSIQSKGLKADDNTLLRLKNISNLYFGN